MSFDLSASLRRLKPEKRRRAPVRRADDALSFVPAAPVAGRPLLLDTTVYIDRLQDRLPDPVSALLRIRQVEHSAVAMAELAHALGRLDPGDPRTARTRQAIEAVFALTPPRRLRPPSVQAIVEAGVLAGVMSRLRGSAPADPQALLNDGQLLLQALEQGCTLLTRNLADLDPLQQIVPGADVLFYRRTDQAG